MMKIKDFWNKLCLELNYVFFAGVPVKDFKLIFNSMDGNKMHYIPTINESIAVGIVSGSFLVGVKGAVFMSSSGFDNINSQLNGFNLFYNLPVLFIVEDSYNPFKLKQFMFNGEDFNVINEVDNYLFDYNKPCILVLSNGDF